MQPTAERDCPPRASDAPLHGWLPSPTKPSARLVRLLLTGLQRPTAERVIESRMYQDCLVMISCGDYRI